MSSPVRFAFLDTPFDREYPVYTRANAGELLPHPVSPLSWSVLGPGFEEGFRTSFCDDFGLLARPGPETPYRMVGRFAARLHLNLSVMRTTAERLPGTSADVIDVQYFGDAGATGLPHHESSGDDRRFRLKSPPTMGRTLAGIGRRVDRDRTAVDELSAEVDRLLAGPDDADTADAADTAEMVATIRRAGSLFARVLATHITARALTSPLLEQASQALHRAGVSPEDTLRFVADIPDLESAKPSRALADIVATIPAGSALFEVLARPGPGAFEALAAADLVGAGALHARLVEFIEAFGHRGLGEFDPMRPVWADQPDDVVRLLGHVRPVPPAPSTPDVDTGRLAKPLVAAARSAMARAERTKDTAMRATNLMRRLLFALRERDLPVAEDHFAHLTITELEAIAHGGEPPVAAELDRRVAEFAEASAVAVAEWSSGQLHRRERLDADAAGTSPASASDTDDEGNQVVRGIAGSPGVAVGPARVIEDPYGPFDEGDVLIATMTDTAWTPLFLSAGAVVTDVGGVLSHATIVARDLGVPAVVNTKTATATIRTGDLVRVDGSAGTVTILSPASPEA